MNVVNTLKLAKKMVKLDKRYNLEILDFYCSVLMTEAKLLDKKLDIPLEEATDVTMVMTYLHDRCVGKRSIFASKIIKEAYEKMSKMCDDRIICESFIFSTSLLEDEEIIKEREYFVSKEGLQHFIDELDGYNKREEDEDGES